uniref:Lipoxygenase homology PLAT domains 1 n=1 Tax=Gadus morhua TaxID=8049 RepID=A0A8C5CVH5_GADMO
TGDVKGAGTDANVFVTLFGDFGVSPKVHLASKSRTAFEKNKTDVFHIKTHNVGPLKKLRIEHDNTGMNAGWFLDRVVVTDVNRPHLRYYFPCNNWLSQEEADSLFVRDLLGSLNPMDVPKFNKYLVSVFTADMKGSGTDADVFINIFGEFGDTGERRLNSDKDNFERGTEDKFTIDSPNLGRLRKITIGHNNRGSSAGWFLDKVQYVSVDDMGNKEIYEFPVNQWFAMDEADGKIQRDILVGSTQPMAIVYNIQVMTGDIRGAGTNSKIHIVMHGTKGVKNSGKVFLEGGLFERGLIDIFNVEICELISPLSRVSIGHDNGAVGAGWYCEKVTIYCPFTGIEQTFPCGRWLDEDEADGLIERELYEMVSLRQKRLKKYPWTLWIFTTDMKGAGTDAQVFLQIYGERGKSDEMKMENNTEDSFEQGQVDKFTIEMPDIGRLQKLRIWHEKRHPFAGWHLAKVTLMKTLTKEKYSFDCGRWLDINEDDNEIIREIPATGRRRILIKYLVTICTGNISGSGTDASVFLNVLGDLGDSGERLMYMSKNNVNKFEKGNHDEFLIEAVSLGQVRRVRVGHDGRGGGCGWFLDKVLVRVDGTPESEAIEFPCDRWLDRNEDDGQIIRELVPAGEGLRLFNVNYQIAIKTGSINGASSDSKVFVKMYGEKGDTCKMMLMVSENDLSNYYETARTDIFTVETFDIGTINRFLIGHTNEGLRAGWFLDSVVISVPVHGKQYMFPSHRWLCKDESDGKVEVEIYPSEILDIERMINYEVTVTTGNLRNGGTNANVFCQIYGEEGKTEVLALKNRSNNFERGTTEIFKVEAIDVGKVYKIRIGHDGSGIGDGWFLEMVNIKRLTMAMVQVEVKVEPKKDKKKDKKKKKKEEEVKVEYIEELQEVVETLAFPSNRWLARDEVDGEIVAELLAEVNSYEIHVFTGSLWGAGTDANVYITIYGEVGDTGDRWLRKSNNLNKFEKNQEDVFNITAVDMGVLKKLRIRQDNSNANAAWFLERVEITDNKDDTTYYFPCKRWLAIDEDDGQVARELVPVDEAFMRKGEDDDEESSTTLGLEQKAMSTTYTLKVKTGEKKYAGTDANVFITLFGIKDDTGMINLKASKTHRNKFELGMTDEFIVEAVDIGPLQKIRIGHDNDGSAGWFLESVEIDAQSLGQRLCFPCGRWLDTGEDDGAIVRDLFPNPLQTEFYTPFVPYEIKIFTSDLFGAGTNADVFIVLYGRFGVCTQQKRLCFNKRERTIFFERGAEDMFIVELEDVGDVIEKIRIGHDNRGVNPGWHLDRVEIRRLLRKGKTIIFPCECWLARSEDDGETVRELVPSDIITEKLARDGSLKVTEIEVEDAISVTTGDVYGAGTDANVFLTMYGDLGDTGERKLSKSETNTNKFERGSVDTFTMEAVDLGQVFKIKIRHDNSLLSPEWYLDQVEVVDLDTEEVFLFQCERWLSKKKEDKQKQEEEGGDSLCSPVIPYHISVSTGLAEDSSTSSRAYVIVVGAGQHKTDRMWLDMTNGRTSFEEGSLESSVCHGADVGEIKKVELGHDGATPESCWLVDELAISAPTRGLKYEFACKCWLAKDRGDGLTSRVFNMLDAETISITRKIIYEVVVLTGDVQNAGTDTNIFMSVFGLNGSTEEMFLQKNEDRFERGQQDTFNLEIDDIAPLKKMRVRIDGTGSRPDWFLDKASYHTMGTYDCLFTYEDWLSRTLGPKHTLVSEMAAVVDGEEMVELTEYIINVKTSDVSAAGTDANVWLIIFGENGDTGTLTLRDSSKSNKFERKQVDTFRFSDILSLGELSKVRVWHDNKGPAPGWHIEYIDVKDEVMDQTFRFPCDRWLAKNEDDGQIMRELPCANNDKLDFNEKTKYEISVTTADTDDAETKENGWVILEGKKARSKEFTLENSSKKKRFQRGGVDSFDFSSKNVGDIASICLGHTPKDGKKVKGEAFWHVEEVIVTEKEMGNRYIFACNAQIPLSAKRDEFMTFECTRTVESFASKASSLVPVKYEIIVITADQKGAGTDANVFITLYGTNGDSGRRQLRQKFRNLFEREQADRFVLEMLDMGELLRVKMEHDNTGLSPGWLLDRVEVTNTANGVTTVFMCGKWLDTKKADGQIFRIIYPKY